MDGRCFRTKLLLGLVAAAGIPSSLYTSVLPLDCTYWTGFSGGTELTEWIYICKGGLLEDLTGHGPDSPTMAVCQRKVREPSNFSVYEATCLAALQ